MKKTLCAIISVLTAIVMTACTNNEIPENNAPAAEKAELNFTLNGKETVISPDCTADDLKETMESLGLEYEIYDEYFHSVSSFAIEDFGLTLSADYKDKFDGTNIYIGENFSGNFDLLGITEKSAVPDIKKLFGEPVLTDTNNDGGENLLWNITVADRPCELWIITCNGKISGISLKLLKNSGSKSSFPLTLDGKTADINLGCHNAEVKKYIEEDLGVTADFAFCDTAYIYDDGFELDITCDSYGIDSLSIFRFEESDNSFDIFGITEKSTLDDVIALFGEYDARLAGDGESEEFCWESVELSGVSFGLSVSKKLDSDRIEIIFIEFPRG